MIETYLLEALVAFREYRTLSRAAEELHISQPALSRSMKKLEEIIGVPLFTRTKNSIALNDAGLLAADKAKKILQAEQAMIDQVRASAAVIRSLKIGYSAPGPELAVTPYLARTHAEIEVDNAFDSEEVLLRDLKDGKYSFVVVSQPVRDPDLKEYLLGTEHLYISAVPAHPLSAYKDVGIRFADINGATFLQTSANGIWDAIKKKMMPDAKILRQDNLDALIEIVNSSSLLSFATDLTIRLFRSRVNPDRVYIPINDLEATVTFRIVSRKDSGVDSLIRELTDQGLQKLS